jgi:septal ring factor EnvC (AmiA/AmiB activator)
MVKGNFIIPILTLLLGGGLTGAILNVVRARNENQKAPIERDSVVVTSAETAVVLMQKVLDATNQQLARKEQELIEVTTTLDRVRGELKELKERCGELESLLEVISAEQAKARRKDERQGRAVP